jgi:hypothetical protein
VSRHNTSGDRGGGVMMVLECRQSRKFSLVRGFVRATLRSSQGGAMVDVLWFRWMANGSLEARHRQPPLKIFFLQDTSTSIFRCRDGNYKSRKRTRRDEASSLTSPPDQVSRIFGNAVQGKTAKTLSFGVSISNNGSASRVSCGTAPTPNSLRAAAQSP